MNSRKIYIFGDSFSAPFDLKTNKDKWFIEYCNFIGREPKMFADFLSYELELEVINCAKGGNDNYTILDSIINNLDKIIDGDLIFIGWSNINRFRMVNSKNVFEPIVNSGSISKYMKVPKDVIDEISVNRETTPYKDELNGYISLCNHLFRNNILIQWSIFYNTHYHGVNVIPVPHKCTTVSQETKFLVKDAHFSETGQRELAHYFLGKIFPIPEELPKPVIVPDDIKEIKWTPKKLI